MRRASPDDSLVGLEYAVWQLLEVFFMDVLRSEGYVAEVRVLPAS